MKKLIIFASLAIALIVGGVIAFLYFNSFQKLTITFKQPNVTGVIYKIGTDSHEGSDDTEVQKIEGNQTINLPKGAYYLRPQGKNVLDTEVPFTLANEPVSIDVDPGFKLDYLAEKLKEEKPKIAAALTAKYPQLFAQYTVSEGQLFAQGEWYAASLTQKVSDTEDEKDTYKVILHKENDQWSVIGKPELVFSAANYPNVPIEVLREINQQDQSS